MKPRRLPVPIQVIDLTAGYDGKTVVGPLTTAFSAGCMTALLGCNGTGKSTLLKTLSGELRPVSGTLIRPVPMSSISYLPQSRAIDRDFPITTSQFATFGLWQKAPFRWQWLAPCWKLPPALALKRDEALDSMGLTTMAESPLRELSGGQFQRLLFTRLMLQNHPVILLDEPFTGIDEETTQALLYRLRAWSEEGKILIAALHDRAQAIQWFDEQLELPGEQ
jgi:zinc/manganese transport system ATP-binding protein